MTNDDFTAFRQLLNAQCEDIMLKKGSDYSGVHDRHRNFKEAAKAMGVSPLVVWGIFMKKHLDSIFTYVREQKVQSEPILERFKDVRNYIDLGAALVAEIELEKSGEFVPPDAVAPVTDSVIDDERISDEDLCCGCDDTVDDD
jgi:hypothetical protein